MSLVSSDGDRLSQNAVVSGQIRRLTSRGDEWVSRLPWRWSITGGAVGFITSASTLIGQPPAMQPSIAVWMVLIITLQAALFWLLIGHWARWSLRVKLDQSVDSALAAIRNDWLNGAAIIAGIPILIRRLIADLNLYPFGQLTVADDFFTALLAFPTLMGGAFALSLISQRALARRTKCIPRGA